MLKNKLSLGCAFVLIGSLAACSDDEAPAPTAGSGGSSGHAGSAGSGGIATGGHAGNGTSGSSGSGLSGASGSSGSGGSSGTSGAPGFDGGTLADADAHKNDATDAVAVGDALDGSAGDAATSDGDAGAQLANLAGNGDLEYGTTNGWSGFCAGTLALGNSAADGGAHAGQYSATYTARSATCSGPSYALPTGPGKYIVSGWGMQNEDATLSGNLQVALTCGAAASANHFPGVAFGVSMPQGVWTKFEGIVDTAAAGADCLPAATCDGSACPGVVKQATLYLNQGSPSEAGVVFPNLFLDDVVVEVTDGHNLIGNPNFESGVTIGWSNNGGGTLGNSTSQAYAGTHSLALTGRTAYYNGPSYALPIGAAKYSVTLWAEQTGSAAHELALQTSYTCLGGAQQYTTAATTSAPASTWVAVSATVTMPPTSAPVDCKLTQASVYLQQGDMGTCGGGDAGDAGIECPDIYIDDASIVIAQ